MATKSGKEYQALTNISLSRPKPQGSTLLEAGARLVRDGEKLTLDDGDQVDILTTQGVIRPWADRDKPRPRLFARDLSGREFPDAAPQLAGTSRDPNREVVTARGTAAPLASPDTKMQSPESQDPQPDDQGQKPAAPAAPSSDPYAK